MRPCSVRLLLLVLLVSLTACRDDEVAQTEDGELVLGAAQVEATSERGVVPGGRTLVLDGFDGRVELTGVPDSSARLTFFRQARGRDEARARELLEAVTVSESGGDQTYRYQMRTDAPGRTSVFVRGEVPESTPLRVQMESGAVEVAGVRGPVHVETTSGPVTVAGASRAVEVDVRNGDVTVGLRAVPAGETVRLHTVNGDVRVVMPRDASAQVDARTEAGGINVDGLAFTDRQLDPRGAGARFRGTLGSGRGSIEIQTQNGTVRLEEGSGTELLMGADSLQRGSSSDAIEEGLVPRRPLTPRDSLRPADEAGGQ